MLSNVPSTFCIPRLPHNSHEPTPQMRCWTAAGSETWIRSLAQKEWMLVSTELAPGSSESLAIPTAQLRRKQATNLQTEPEETTCY